MKLRFLGTGTSTGNPEIGCLCAVCTSINSKDRRFRSSVLIEIENKHILIDCGPDFRMQMLETFRTDPFVAIDGVLITHEHYDHVGGLDDLRVFCRKGKIAVYAESNVAKAIRSRMPYAFHKDIYIGTPNLRLHVIGTTPFVISGIAVIPIRLMHGNLPILGYRIGKMAYLTDLKTIPESEYAKLQGLDVLIINALRKKEHISHETIDEALRNIKYIRPQQAYITHVCHSFGLHETVQKTLPTNVSIAFDGLEMHI